MGKGKGKIIVVALIFFSAEGQAVSWSLRHNGCGACKTHHLLTLHHCQQSYDNSAGLSGPFESEYDMEKWEKALRQGVAGKTLLCRVGSTADSRRSQ